MKCRTFRQARRGRARTPTPGRYYGPPKRHERERGPGEPLSLASSFLFVLNTTLQVLPWLIGCTIHVRMTPVTPAVGTIVTVTEIATTGRGTTIIGTKTGVTTETDVLGTTRGGINVFSNHKPSRGYNILCFSLPIHVQQYCDSRNVIWIVI